MLLLFSLSVMSDSLWTHGLQHARLLCTSLSPSDSEVAQSCPTLCNPMDYRLPSSIVHGIFQQEYWSGLPFPSPEDLSNPGIWIQVSRIGGRHFYHVSHPEYAQIHVFWVHDAIKSSHPLLPSAHFAFNLSLHQGLFQWGGASHQVAKVLELQHRAFHWIFRVDFI